ncbi:hypothetical protein C6P40_001233 [Pichia californica]|uniref:Protein CCC1 n=1 Tax=Pichia californica TaxID=460514 RepID=A0A9P7BI09_9ASCO|nr:hypothetical protein C6P42_004411 [[Candida] californica]KAG0690799.1 hypothetical protein C6P40_001233 [[Candida] californica]
MSLVAIKNLITSTISYTNKSNDDLITDENSPLINDNTNNTTNNNNTTITTSELLPNNNANNNNNDNDNNNNNDSFNNDLESNYSSTSVLSYNSNNNEYQPFPLNLINNVDPRVMSDLIIGLSDGLTVPFALTAGLSSLGNSKLVITGGMAELVSGAISMGLGGFLAAKSENEFYFSQIKKEKQLFFKNKDSINDELYEILIDMGASNLTIENFLNDLSKNPQKMIDFIIKFGKGLEEPPEGRMLSSALTIGFGYFFGGFIPLIPYFFFETVANGLFISVIVMILTLFWFGYFKSMISMGADCSSWTRISEGFQMVLIGSIAAGSAWSLVYLIDN